jgi:hypothetical protein
MDLLTYFKGMKKTSDFSVHSEVTIINSIPCLVHKIAVINRQIMLLFEWKDGEPLMIGVNYVEQIT